MDYINACTMVIYNNDKNNMIRYSDIYQSLYMPRSRLHGFGRLYYFLENKCLDSDQRTFGPTNLRTNEPSEQQTLGTINLRSQKPSKQRHGTFIRNLYIHRIGIYFSIQPAPMIWWIVLTSFSH